MRDHCQSMIDKDDPASIWWGDTEALAEAIKALSLDIDKNQKGEKDMTSEVKVGNYRRYGYLFHRIQGGGVFERKSKNH